MKGRKKNSFHTSTCWVHQHSDTVHLNMKISVLQSGIFFVLNFLLLYTAQVSIACFIVQCFVRFLRSPLYSCFCQFGQDYTRTIFTQPHSHTNLHFHMPENVPLMICSSKCLHRLQNLHDLCIAFQSIGFFCIILHGFAMKVDLYCNILLTICMTLHCNAVWCTADACWQDQPPQYWELFIFLRNRLHTNIYANILKLPSYKYLSINYTWPRFNAEYVEHPELALFCLKLNINNRHIFHPHCNVLWLTSA